MAIKAVSNSNPQVTYQGSASGAEMSQVSLEATAVNSSTLAAGKGERTQAKVQKEDTNGEDITTVNIGTEAMKKAVEEINKNARNSEAIFGIHEATNRVTIKIVDKDSKKVIKEYPPEKTLDMIAKVWEMAGLMVDEKR